MSDTPIRASVIVAVYNRETLLDRCIDSLVYQSFDGGYEVLLVDDGSTDGSWDVMSAWAARHPEKVRIFRNPVKGVAHAKNLGISEARGEYVMFVDSDDYASYDALKLLFAEVDEARPELVVSPIWRVVDGRKRSIGQPDFEKHPTWGVKDLLLAGEYFFLPGKLIRADLFAIYGRLPALGVSEDVSWMFPVLTRLKDVRYVRHPTYYYEYSENSITTTHETVELGRDAIAATRLILEKSAPECRGFALRYALTRAMGFVATRYPSRRDEVVADVSAAEREIAESDFFAQNYPTFIDRVRKFLQAPAAARTRSTKRGWNVVRPADIAIPDRSEMPAVVAEAAEAGRDGFVREWAAVRRLVEGGGLYLHDDIVLDSDLSELDDFEAMMVYSGDEKVFSSKVFACRAGNPLFAEVLATYEWPEVVGREETLSDRLRLVAVGGTSAPIAGSDLFENAALSFAVLPAESFLGNPLGVEDVPVYSHDASLCGPAGAWAGAVFIRSVFERCRAHGRRELEWQKRRCAALNRELAASQKARRYNWQEARRLEEGLAESQKARRYNWQEVQRLEEELAASQKARRYNWKEAQRLEKEVAALRPRVARWERVRSMWIIRFAAWISRPFRRRGAREAGGR